MSDQDSFNYWPLIICISVICVFTWGMQHYKNGIIACEKRGGIYVDGPRNGACLKKDAILNESVPAPT